MELEEYVAARGQTLLRLAHVLTGDPHLAEDLTQSALAAAYRHWRRVVRADHPDAYVRRILVNRHLAAALLDRVSARAGQRRPAGAGPG